jgi:nucleotide-binding universal stress UspA family protein
MERILVPVDGSKPSERAVRHVIRLSVSGMALRVVLLNVQEPWAPARSRAEEEEGKRLHAQAANRAMRRARALLKAAGIPFDGRMLVGPAAERIVRLARDRRCSHIVMGMRGLGALARMVIGSVSMKVVQLADVPVTLVK